MHILLSSHFGDFHPSSSFHKRRMRSSFVLWRRGKYQCTSIFWTWLLSRAWSTEMTPVPVALAKGGFLLNFRCPYVHMFDGFLSAGKTVVVLLSRVMSSSICRSLSSCRTTSRWFFHVGVHSFNLISVLTRGFSTQWYPRPSSFLSNLRANDPHLTIDRYLDSTEQGIGWTRISRRRYSKIWHSNDAAQVLREVGGTLSLSLLVLNTMLTRNRCWSCYWKSGGKTLRTRSSSLRSRSNCLKCSSSIW